MDNDLENKRKHRYITDKNTEDSLRTWMVSASIRPDIFIIAPAVRDVGERQLIDLLADASYRLGGHADARRRHRLERTFPIYGSMDEYNQFLDEPFLTAEITDEFYGTDTIDLSAWVGKTFDDPGSPWHYLTTHINAHPETDFVFIAYTDDPSMARAVSQRITMDTGIALEEVELGFPAASDLTEEFQLQSEGEFQQLGTAVREQFERLANDGKEMNYAFARSCALYALHRLAISDDKDTALVETFARYEAMPVTPGRTNTIGFV